jgi:hypothetical protein
VLRFRIFTRAGVTAGRRITFKLRLSRRALRSLRRAFRHRKSFSAKVTVSARDAAGNAGSKRLRVRLVR